MRKNTLSLIFLFICILSAILTGCNQSRENEVKTPLSSTDCIRKDYSEVVSAFEKAGFSNIQMVALDDLITGWITKDGSVESVSMGDSSDFKKNAWFPKETLVTITYHTFPQKETGEDQSTTTPSQDNAKSEQATIFSTLTDEQFSSLTEAVAKSFYTFTLSESEQQSLAADTKVMECLTQIYQYAYKNNFELDPEYKSAFSVRADVVKNIPSYELLKERFMIEYYRDSSIGQWICTINSYSVNPKDVVTYDGDLYIDAEGYLQKGVVLYWEEDGAMVKVGEIKDIAYDKEIDGTAYGYALNVEYYDDPYSSGWTDGQIILAMNKKFAGKPIYYVSVLDPNRSIAKQDIDYDNSVNWKLLTVDNLTSGIEVYYGISSTKSYIFTVESVDLAGDKLTVRYASGNIEVKSCSAMLALGYLYIK